MAIHNKQVYWYRFSSSIGSLHVSHILVISHKISNFLIIIIFVMVIFDVIVKRLTP